MAESSSDNGTSKIRNICIMAHVDHGKTTLADHLIAGCGGGLVHRKMAGRIRFMDFLDEEQRRAITMKSSSVKLSYKDHQIHLIDSPGHIDFCSEVSTAARLSDGALILVDSVEGVHIQTHAVLRQAWVEKLTPCLVINKIDRLITELKLTPMEAYTKLLRIIHEVNCIFSAFKSEKYLSDVDALLSKEIQEIGEISIEEQDEEDTFHPQKGNVVFSCALDGWGFCLDQFVDFWSGKLERVSKTALLKALWGPWYYNNVDKKFVGKKGMKNVSKNPQPVFVEFVLKQIWQLYQTVLDGDKEVIKKVVKKFNLEITENELQHKDSKGVLQAVMSSWLPLSEAVLSMVVKCLPDPKTAQSFRISRLVPEKDSVPTSTDADVSADVIAEAEYVRNAIKTCDSSENAPCVAFVSKMFAVSSEMLPKNPNFPNGTEPGQTGHSDEVFLAFARVFSGTLRVGQKIFVLSALYDPFKLKSDPLMQRHIQEVELHQLYEMMGQGVKSISSCSAGNLVAIQGLGQHILKNATLSTSKNCYPFSSMNFQVTPTLRVAVEPKDPADMSALMKGLRLLNRADPFVEITVSSRGEQVISAAGEVHLERCVKDLEERFAKIKLVVSRPLVSFKETIEGEGGNSVEKLTPNGRCVVTVQVLKLPSGLTKVLEENGDLLGEVLKGKMGNKERNSVVELRKKIVDAIESEAESIDGDKERVEKFRKTWFRYLERIWALGPRQMGPNLLILPETLKSENHNSNSSSSTGVLVRGSCHVSEILGFSNPNPQNPTQNDELQTLIQEAETLKSSVVSGFQLATSAGPLCDEPMWGLAFIIEPHIFPDNSENAPLSDSIFTGQVLTAVKEACRASVLQNNPRLVEAMYFCELNTRTEYLGQMYAVLSRRRARVLKEEMQEGSNLFTVHAYLPVEASNKFADELRTWTSGASSAILVLSHWEMINEDPFFVPKTEEEIEEFGDGASVLPNLARRLMDDVRRRKGLHVEEKVVKCATKQRTLARKV
ncbi:hypothetical protein LUZ60_005415 [Juncus effusus]|nr:hypothetical protein LUZ60_005415 [Juncus effusus]